MSAAEVIESVLSWFVKGSMLCTTATVQSYVVHLQPALCTTDLRFVKYVNLRFVMYVVSHHLDGAQCDVVSLAVCVSVCDCTLIA